MDERLPRGERAARGRGRHLLTGGLAILGALWAQLLAADPDPRDVGPDRVDVSSYPPEYRERYQVFSVRCSKCHTLARPINARIRGDEWKRYIKKMIRRPGSGINEESGQQIYEFLKYYSTRQDEPPGSADGGVR